MCGYISSNFHSRRLPQYECPSVESLWLSVRLTRLPRSISAILLAVVYHSTVSRRIVPAELYLHIQCNVHSFLHLHPNALVLVKGDFNFRSMGFDANHAIATGGDVILGWCLSSSKDSSLQSVQLPSIGTSDHYTILMKGQAPLIKPDNSPICKRDLRDSRIRPFGRHITAFDWTPILNIHDYDAKYEKFNNTMTAMIDNFFPLERTKVRRCDKPWITSSIKCAIAGHQKAFHRNGKNSGIYKYWRNKVQLSIKLRVRNITSVQF